MGLSRTARYYRDNPKARKKRNAYQKKYNKKKREIKKRMELNKINRRRGTYGNGDNMDASHTSNGRVVMRTQSRNRGDRNDRPGDRRARG
jgi:hypothetical protein